MGILVIAKLSPPGPTRAEARGECPLWLTLTFAARLLEWDCRKHVRTLSANGVKCPRVEIQCLKDGRRHLCSAHLRVDRLRTEGRVGQEQNDVRIVMGEATVLRELLCAAGISDADIRGHDDIRRARVYGWVVEVKCERRAVIDLPKANSMAEALCSRMLTLAWVSEEFFSQISETSSSVGPMPVGVVGGFGVRNIARIREQA